MGKFDIDMPDDLEIKNQISLILDKGLEKEENFYSYIKNMYKKIGFKNLFHDKAELIFIGVLLLSILLLGILGIKRNSMISKEKVYTFIFIISPLYYLITNIFSFMNMKENNTYEIEMVCKYNLYQISALRMLVFSVISIFLSAIFILGLYSKINILRGIMISLTSIFLFSSLLLYSMVKLKSEIGRYLIIGFWIIGNLILLRLSSNQYFEFLQTMPMIVYVFVAVTALLIYMKNIQKLSNYKKVVMVN